MYLTSQRIFEQNFTLPLKLLHRKWNGEMRYIPNIRMKKIIKPTGINEVSQEKSAEQESPEVKQVPELEAVVSHDNDSTTSDPISGGGLQDDVSQT